MTVFLFPNKTKDTDLSVTCSAVRLLRDFGAHILMEPEYSEWIGPDAAYLPVGEGIAAADVVITVGGDGTLLRAANECLRDGKPVLGINLGRTGFLATCEVPQMAAKLKRLTAGEYRLEQRSLLRAESNTGWQATALNDVVLYSRSRQHPWIMPCTVTESLWGDSAVTASLLPPPQAPPPTPSPQAAPYWM